MSVKEITPFVQTNSWAMFHGVFLGVWGILSMVAYYASVVSDSSWSITAMLMMVSSPLVAYFLSKHFREVCGEVEFTFGRGFTHTLLMGMYATLWVALMVFVYLHYFDNGSFFDAYEVKLSSEEVVQELKRVGVWEIYEQSGGVRKMINVLRSFGAANYAALIIYFSLIVGPLFSLIIGGLLKRK